LAEEINMRFSGKVSEVDCRPSEHSGAFEVFLGDELVYSKLKQTGRLPHPGEVEQILFERLLK
jgi:selT/selW/selH-like putative selenoprotein